MEKRGRAREALGLRDEKRKVNDMVRFAEGKVAGQPVAVGDRIFVRVMSYFEQDVEFMVNNVASYTDLVGEIRYVMRGRRGLVNLFIRNHSRGWSCEKRMMLYADGGPFRRRPYREAAEEPKAGKRMLFPWETH